MSKAVKGTLVKGKREYIKQIIQRKELPIGKTCITIYII